MKKSSVAMEVLKYWIEFLSAKFYIVFFWRFEPRFAVNGTDPADYETDWRAGPRSFVWFVVVRSGQRYHWLGWERSWCQFYIRSRGTYLIISCSHSVNDGWFFVCRLLESSCTNTISILYAERIRLLKMVMNSSQNVSSWLCLVRRIIVVSFVIFFHILGWLNYVEIVSGLFDFSWTFFKFDYSWIIFVSIQLKSNLFISKLALMTILHFFLTVILFDI